MLGATDRYLLDVDKMGQQAKDLEHLFTNLVSKPAETPEPPIETTLNVKAKPPPLPDTEDPLALLGFDIHYPPNTFSEIRRVYKETVKLYHPDVLLSPDSTEQEREVASANFARINSAFELLKKREEDKDNVYSYDMYIDGNRVTKTASSSYDDDDYRIDYDRIRQVIEYNQRYHPREKMWYEEEYEYYEPLLSQQARQERYWARKDGVYEYEDDYQTNWRNGGSYGERSMEGFLYSNEPEGTTHTYQTWSHRNMPKEGFPYKERLWNERHMFDTPRFSNEKYEYYNSNFARGYDRFREKWWTKEHDEYNSHFNGDFGP
jgi:curved DNA-binding protein CbpA